MAWWSLTCRMAQDWKRERDRVAASRPSAGDRLPAGSAVADGGALDLAVRSEPGVDAAADGAPRHAASLPPAEPAFDVASKRPADDARTAPAGRASAGAQACAACGVIASGCDAVGLGVPSANPIAPGAMPNQPPNRGVPSANRGLKGLNDASMASSSHHSLEGDAHGVLHVCSIPRPAQGRSDGLCGQLGLVSERPVRRGAAGLPRREGQASGVAVGAGADAGTAGCACECSGIDAEGRSESALPVRQRPEVQALPRQGLKVPPPASLATEPGTAVASDHNRGQGPQGAIL